MDDADFQAALQKIGSAGSADTSVDKAVGQGHKPGSVEKMLRKFDMVMFAHKQAKKSAGLLVKGGASAASGLSKGASVAAEAAEAAGATEVAESISQVAGALGAVAEGSLDFMDTWSAGASAVMLPLKLPLYFLKFVRHESVMREVAVIQKTTWAPMMHFGGTCLRMAVQQGIRGSGNMYWDQQKLIAGTWNGLASSVEDTCSSEGQEMSQEVRKAVGNLIWDSRTAYKEALIELIAIGGCLGNAKNPSTVMAMAGSKKNCFQMLTPSLVKSEGIFTAFGQVRNIASQNRY